MFPLYYGWFLHITDTKLLVEAVKGMIEKCLDITEFSSDIFEKTGCKNMQGIINHYSWLKSAHCTSRYDHSKRVLTSNISNFFLAGSHKEQTKGKSMQRRPKCLAKPPH